MFAFRKKHSIRFRILLIYCLFYYGTPSKVFSLILDVVCVRFVWLYYPFYCLFSLLHIVKQFDYFCRRSTFDNPPEGHVLLGVCAFDCSFVCLSAG